MGTDDRYESFDKYMLNLGQSIMKKRKDYSKEQWDRLTFLERKQVLDHAQNEHKILMKRSKLRKNRKK